MRPLLIITAFLAEARPLIEHWGLKPHPSRLLSQFQTFVGDGCTIAISGLGKTRSAAATSALLAIQPAPGDCIVANIGVAGCHSGFADLGELSLSHKIVDAGSGTRFYPDLLLAHSLPERPLTTYDAPVFEHPPEASLADMEGSGFFQAASFFVPPSQIVLLKIVSDLCDGTKVAPRDASKLIAGTLPSIDTTTSLWRTKLPPSTSLDATQAALLRELIEYGRFSTTQANELSRVTHFKHATGVNINELLETARYPAPATKHESKKIFETVLAALGAGELP